MASCVPSPFQGGRYSFDGTPRIHHANIESIFTMSIPENSVSTWFVREPHDIPYARDEEDLDELLPYVPDPLPAALEQGDCEFGGDLVVTTFFGRTIAYGPCDRPASIDALWDRISEISNKQ